MKISIAFDGYSSTGKSSISKLIAEKYNLCHIDSGALYRLITLAILKANIDPSNSISKEFLEILPLDFKIQNNRAVFSLKGEEFKDEIRSPKVNVAVSKVAAQKVVREYVNQYLQSLSSAHSVIMDGRDIGSIVLPNADLKFFLTADIEERTQRRFLELKASGQNISLDEVRTNLADRDYADATREISPLIMAEDAIRIDNTLLNKNETFDLICSHIDQYLLKTSQKNED